LAFLKESKAAGAKALLFFSNFCGPAEQLAEKVPANAESLKIVPQGLKPHAEFAGFAARVNSRPDTKQSAEGVFQQTVKLCAFKAYFLKHVLEGGATRTTRN